MTHDELLGRIKYKVESCNRQDIDSTGWSALRAVVELHKPNPDDCPCCGPVLCYSGDGEVYPCPTIQIIEENLNG